MKKILCCAIVVCMAGCKKDTVTKPLPVIEITTPTKNQHFVMGETIHITGNVTHSIELTEVAVHMTDLTSNVEFFHNHFSAGNVLSYHFDSTYPIPDDKKNSFKVEVEAADKDGNTTSEEITITIN